MNTAAHSFTAFFLLISALLMHIPLTQAAIQGGAGSSSTGQIVLRFSINPTYQISRVDDIVLEISNRDKAVSHMERLCIRGPKDQNFTITANSEQGNDFAVIDELGNRIAFQLYFYKDLKMRTPDRLYPSARSQTYPITATEEQCSGQDNSAIELLIKPESLRDAKVGEYNGVLVLTIGSV